MLTFVGIPVFFIELAVGQYSGSGPATVWEAAPLFRGKQSKIQLQIQIQRKLMHSTPERDQCTVKPALVIMHLGLATTSLQRPVQIYPQQRIFSSSVLYTAATCLQRPHSFTPKGGCCRQV